jgi:dCMP deaminase
MQKLRPDIDEYFLKIAKVVSERSTCIRRKVGAIAVKDRHILATGYNGASAGLKDCLELGCRRDQLNVPSGSATDVCRAVHAEQNVIIQAAVHGISLKGATIYSNTSPCAACARMLINAKIKKFVCCINYTNNEATELFKEAQIELIFAPEPSFDSSKIKERVLAVDNKTFIEAGYFTGFKHHNDEDFYTKIRSNVRYIDRDFAEVNEDLKQIIPYVLIRHNDEFLVLKRLTSSTEERLINAYTFGVGGHINPIDSLSGQKGKDIIEKGMLREVSEEISTDGLGDIKLIGYLYDDKQDVSRHHIGFVYLCESKTKDIEVLEKDVLSPQFVKVNDLPKFINGKENWAEIIYESYISKKFVKKNKEKIIAK